jgi:hypothetical protein
LNIGDSHRIGGDWEGGEVLMIKEIRGNIEEEIIREARRSSEDKGTWMKRKPEKRERIEDKGNRDDTESRMIQRRGRNQLVKLVW